MFEEHKNKRVNRIFDIINNNKHIESFKESRKYASDDEINILLTGETGTGKEVHARYIHTISSRKDKPFVVATFSAISGSLVQSTLFGHVKGSFTGAVCDQKGLFKAADGGTIFLDEIGDANLETQSALLRVIEDGEIQTIGKPNSDVVDVRIIAASNVDFQEKIMEKSFRRDLYYRLKGAEIHLEPLRAKPVNERKETIEKLISDFAVLKNKTAIQLTNSVWSFLLNYEFKGNYREARNIIERLYFEGKSIIDIQDIERIIIPQYNSNYSTNIKEKEIEKNNHSVKLKLSRLKVKHPFCFFNQILKNLILRMEKCSFQGVINGFK